MPSVSDSPRDLLSRITDTAAELGDLDLVEFSRQFTLELPTAAAGEQPSTNPVQKGDNWGRGKRGETSMTSAELRDSVNSLSTADQAEIQLASLVEKQCRILGEPIPDLVLRVLRGEKTALRPA